ncbi:related to THG1 - protein required for tRNA-His guanylylation at 5` end [Ustilago trichophora]|uniref:tRNA(His) guanylyltransferase n=1 Tax=Ustilago trichophora TaxID=86804 RepID=A0A5C3DS96_9BASI|nr:related to THG1 - protein required for tRNA-His guanylylation at 5` end [Ustilago trichophora]
MAGTKFAYVRNFELPDSVIPDTYLVVRIDGKGFHKFSAAHNFAKPNDAVALELMNEAARYVMRSLKGQVALAFGESDEYSFLLRKSTTLYSRRNSKITTHIVSLFTSAYVWNWTKFFPNNPLLYPPSFDGRMVVYPNEKVVRDYFSWRQADTHINNLYNTTFWALVLQGGRTEQEATKELECTVSADKHEILHSQFGINYDTLESIFRKGSTLVWTAGPSAQASSSSSSQPHSSTEDAEQDDLSAKEDDAAEQAPVLSNPKDEKLRLKIERKRVAKEAKKQEKRDKKAQLSTLRTLHCDIIGDEFWLPLSTDASQPSEEVQGEALGDVRTSQPWNHPSRLQGVGLGSSVFLD